MAGASRRDADPPAASGERKAPASGTRATYSGRLLLRMPRQLHAELAESAEREGVSLNQLIIGTLTSAVTAERSEVEEAPPRREPRLLVVALAVNLVVIVLAGSIAVALLITVWRRGF